MANPLKGEVAFEAEGKAYILVLDFNALCEVEGVLGGSIGDLSSMSAVRAVFWGALQRHHAGLTLIQAGDLIASVGFAKAAELVTKAVEASGLGGDGAATAGPPKAAPKATTGKRR